MSKLSFRISGTHNSLKHFRATLNILEVMLIIIIHHIDLQKFRLDFVY